ncbi:hypothetical protein HDU81_003211 [Chytriomyces hyalinus]|nr:hypothetical protein HDU81_003211 [Chytriomyces hyalinus]
MHGLGLRGSIPTVLGKLDSLTMIDLTDNQLTGNIPTQFGNLKRLVSIDLSGNQLAGSIPTHLKNLTDLVFLDLSYNKFSGKIPIIFTDKSEASFLNLANNKFKGSIPTALASVTTLDLSGNKFSGAIPDELLHSGLEFANLVTRKLSRNRLTGKPPVLDAFGAMMNVFEASGNLLKGPLLGSCVETSFLDRLDLSGNEISGSFPAGVSSCDFLTNLNLANNKLKGSIPDNSKLDVQQVFGDITIGIRQPQTANCTVTILFYSLIVDHLNDNQFSGPIPSSFVNLAAIPLQTLSIDKNKLTGCVPAALAEIAILVHDKENAICGTPEAESNDLAEHQIANVKVHPTVSSAYKKKATTKQVRTPPQKTSGFSYRRKVKSKATATSPVRLVTRTIKLPLD